MLAREKELRRSSATQRAYALRLTDSVTVSREIQVRVVREFGLPDEAIEVFESLSEQEGRGGMDMDHDVEVFGRMWNEPPDLHQQIEPTRTPEVGRFLHSFLGGVRLGSSRVRFYCQSAWLFKWKSFLRIGYSENAF